MRTWARIDNRISENQTVIICGVRPIGTPCMVEIVETPDNQPPTPVDGFQWWEIVDHIDP
jgi:hypothetical protein